MTKKKADMIKRIIISGGGTGGHIFPAISIAQAVQGRYPQAKILFIGAEGRMEMERIPQAGFPIKGLSVRGLNRKHLWKNLSVIKDYLKSFYLARNIVREFQPQVVVGVGGYASAPTLRAAQSLNIPTLIQEQNSYAGVTNKWLSRRAQRICVAYPQMERFFPKDKIVITGNPVRPEIEVSQVSRQEALAYFGFSPCVQRTVVVIGGSLGSHTINKSISEALSEFEREGISLIWQTGTTFAPKAQRLLEGYNFPSFCSPFISRMDLAYNLADIVVSRAGASAISELCILGKPTILVPSPNVAEDHQTKNALALSSRGAALLIPDNQAPDSLPKAICDLMNNSVQRQELSSAICKLAYHNAAQKIIDELETLL